MGDYSDGSGQPAAHTGSDRQTGNLIADCYNYGIFDDNRISKTRNFRFCKKGLIFNKSIINGFTLS
jgi:hypothetical protein